ncbi:MAG: hypothetical protein ACRDJO_10815 [Actinomycetota bacterium]
MSATDELGLDTGCVPDGIEPIVGWRYWRVDGSALGSLTRDAPWSPLQGFEAGCRLAGRHGPVPDPACNCGVYAARDLRTLQAMATPSVRHPLAVGKVALWGRIIPAERGYRAQFGYPKRLWLIWESLEQLGHPGAQRVDIAAAYGVPVEFCDADWALSRAGDAGDERRWITPDRHRPPALPALRRLARLLLGIR